MTGRRKEVVVPKEKALFWLDKHGFWHNETEKFRHPGIIKHFHSAIRKDKDGYYLFQEHPDYTERVYFPYEDTAVFVFEVIKEEAVILVLNTSKRTKLKPRNLFVRNDNLYMHADGDRIKFTERALVQMSDLLEDENGQLFIRIRGRRYRVREKPDDTTSGLGRR
jgi:hypothetical protein